ncbi:MAG: HDOD domain-containing protein [Methylophilaceae bacterium]|nr:HDOD domain-containing protein [Methylophilaceae bacterium]
MQQPKTLEHWLGFLAEAEIPVLRHTARELVRLRERENALGARDVTRVVMQDPMMTARLLRYLQAHKHARQTRELVEVEQTLLMMGISRFFEVLPARLTVEDVLREQMAALVQLLHVVHRAHRASHYAFEWALLLHDLHAEEIRIAALLHDLAEMLMWIYAPVEMLQIRQLQAADRTLRSKEAQARVLGFTLHDLHREVAAAWNLPELLQVLMEDEHAETRRVKNVKLAVDLARHSANGWDDAALPDDYAAIAELLRLSQEEVIAMLVPQPAEPEPG